MAEETQILKQKSAYRIQEAENRIGKPGNPDNRESGKNRPDRLIF